MTRKLRLPDCNNVGPNQRATLNVPLGMTYNKIILFCAGNITASLLSNIVVKMNNNERIRWATQAHLQARNSYNRGASDAAVLELDFIEREGTDEAAMTLGAYAATAEAGCQSMTIEFDIGNYTNTTASKITAIAEVDVPSANRLIVRNRLQQISPSGAIETQIVVNSGANGELLKRLYIFGTLSLIDFLRIKREGIDEFQELTVAQNEFYQRTYGKTPQSGLYVVDFTEHDLMGHMLNTGSIVGLDKKAKPIANLEVTLKVNGAGTFTIYTESITTNERA